jgi:hypothetical protein
MFVVRLALAAGRVVGVPLPSLSLGDIVPGGDGVVESVQQQISALNDLVGKLPGCELPSAPDCEALCAEARAEQKAWTTSGLIKKKVDAKLPEKLRGADYISFKAWLTKTHPRWDKSAAMTKVTHGGRVEWVSDGNVNKWKSWLDDARAGAAAAPLVPHPSPGSGGGGAAAAAPSSGEAEAAPLAMAPPTAAPPQMSRVQSSAVLVDGELMLKHRLGRWPSSFFQLGTDNGEVTLLSCKKKGGKISEIWTVTDVENIKDRPKKQINRFDVTATGGQVVALSAPTAADKKRWINAIRAAIAASPLNR